MMLTPEERNTILNGGMIDAVRIWNCHNNVGIVMAKRGVEAVRAGKMRLEEFFGSEAQMLCPHCKGTGYINKPPAESVSQD